MATMTTTQRSTLAAAAVTLTSLAQDRHHRIGQLQRLVEWAEGIIGSDSSTRENAENASVACLLAQSELAALELAERTSLAAERHLAALLGD